MTEFVCGIDFGTSNTSVSVASKGVAPRMVPLDGRNETIASAIFFPAGNRAAFYGQSAIDAYIERIDGRFMRSFKRALGTSLMQDGTYIEGRPVSFEQIISQFVAHVKATAEKHVDAPVMRAVVGRPVHFVDGSEERDQLAQTQLESAILAAGFESVSFQYEPIGAAFAHELALDTEEHLAMVVDIGGGTSDFTVIKLSKSFVAKVDRSDDVLGSAGVRVGGNDFDRKLSLREIMPDLGMGTLVGPKSLVFPSYPFFDLAEWAKVHLAYAPKYKREVYSHMVGSHAPEKVGRLRTVLEKEYGHLLLSLAERAKIELSFSLVASLNLDLVASDLAPSISRSNFEDAISMEIEKISTAIMECLIQAEKKAGDINLVVLTGGGTGVPVVRSLVQRLLPNAKVSAENMLSSVGLGLGYDAFRRYLT